MVLVERALGEAPRERERGKRREERGKPKKGRAKRMNPELKADPPWLKAHRLDAILASPALVLTTRE